MTKAENKNAYDLTVLLKEEEASFVQGLIEKAGGTDIESEINKMNFAYEVKGVDQGFMAVFNFWMSPNSAEDLKKEFKANRNILRHLLLRDNLREKESDKNTTETRQRPESKPKEKEGKDKDTSETLTNEAIEQKIEEIME